MTGATIKVDDVAVQVLSSSATDASFFWPPHALGPVSVTAVRSDPSGDLVSDPVTVTYVDTPPKPIGAALGGPFGVQPQFKQKVLTFVHVRTFQCFLFSLNIG